MPSAVLERTFFNGQSSAPPGSTSASKVKDKSVVSEAGNGGRSPDQTAENQLDGLYDYI